MGADFPFVNKVAKNSTVAVNLGKAHPLWKQTAMFPDTYMLVYRQIKGENSLTGSKCIDDLYFRFNSLAPGRCPKYFRKWIFKCIFW